MSARKQGGGGVAIVARAAVAKAGEAAHLPPIVSRSPNITAEAVLSAAPVLPVVVIDDATVAAPLARALLAGGLGAIEITLRTQAALEAIRAVATAVPEMLVGAGTVLNEADLDAAMEAGARFALSPGATPKLLKAARDAAIPFIPGTATSSEVMRGLDLGYRHFKFFPAEQLGGAAAVKALAGPLPHARFCPTGGISLAQAASYLALDNVMCVGGSWVAPTDIIKARDWNAVTALARQAAALKPIT